ncbi:MAG: hypothetical protein QX199_15340 [Methylococcaceae bacterium]
MVNSTLAKRIKSLELLATPKQAMLVLHCWERPDEQQMLMIEDAERRGRRVIIFGGRYAWAWVSGDDAQRPWEEEDNSSYNFVPEVAA